MAKTHVSNFDYQILAYTIELVSQNGNLKIANSANKGAVSLSALGVIQIGVPSVAILASNYSDGGAFTVNAGGSSPQIQLAASSEVAVPSLNMNNEGIAISYLVNDGGPASALTFGSGLLSAVVSEGAAFSKLLMTPESVTIEVGSTILEISDEGFMVTSGETIFNVTPEGINETSGDTTRKLNLEGHNFNAAETKFNVGASGIEASSSTFMVEVDGSNEVTAASLTASYDASGDIESAMTTIQ